MHRVFAQVLHDGAGEGVHVERLVEQKCTASFGKAVLDIAFAGGGDHEEGEIRCGFVLANLRQHIHSIQERFVQVRYYQ